MTTAGAVAYLGSVGIPITPVTVKRYVARGWSWYAPSVGQMLSDAALVTLAEGEREIRA